MYLFTRALAVLCLTAAWASANTFSFEGTFQADDQIQLFQFTETASGVVTLQTFGYAGGVNGNGQTIPEGGFDPFLSLFDSSGNLFAENDDGGCAHVNVDSQSGGCADSFIQVNLPIGTYTLALTQTGNEPAGTTLADGFTEEGAGNYSCGGGYGNFCDPATYTDRTGNYAVDISGDAVVLPGQTGQVPEPNSLLLTGAALGLCGMIRLRWISRKSR